MIKLSYTNKMRVNGKRVPSWSLQARTSCPGSKINGEVVEVCKGCYATKGFYHMPVVKNLRKHNQTDYHRSEWVTDMTTAIKKSKYMRWFDSGDIETPELLNKILEVVKLTPNTTHWLPTRSDNTTLLHKPITAVIANCPSNLVVRPSANAVGVTAKERTGVNSYVIEAKDIPLAKSKGVFICPATTPGTTQKSCDTCTMCYTGAKVAYVLH